MSKLNTPRVMRLPLTAMTLGGLLIALPATAGETTLPQGPVANTVMPPVMPMPWRKWPMPGAGPW